MKSTLNENKKEVIGLLEEGRPTRLIAKKYGVTQQTVGVFARRNNVKIRKLRKLDGHSGYISAEIMRGRTISSLSCELECSVSCLKRHLKRYGVKTRLKLDGIKKEIVEYYSDGLSTESISVLVNHPEQTIRDGLKSWGVEMRSAARPEVMESMALNDLKSNWIDVDRPSVVTVGRIPKFYLVPIS